MINKFEIKNIRTKLSIKSFNLIINQSNMAITRNNFSTFTRYRSNTENLIVRCTEIQNKALGRSVYSGKVFINYQQLYLFQGRRQYRFLDLPLLWDYDRRYRLCTCITQYTQVHIYCMNTVRFCTQYCSCS